MGKVLGPGMGWPQKPVHRTGRGKSLFQRQFAEVLLILGRKVVFVSPQGIIVAKGMGDYIEVEFKKLGDL